MRRLGLRRSPSPSRSLKTLILPCINPVANKPERKPNHVVENDRRTSARRASFRVSPRTLAAHEAAFSPLRIKVYFHFIVSLEFELISIDSIPVRICWSRRSIQSAQSYEVRHSVLVY